MLSRFIILVLFVSLIIGCATTQINPPTLIKKIEPEYPREAELKGLEGKVGLHILVSDSGIVKVAKVAKSSKYPILDEAALDYAKKLRFHPAIKNGNPVAVWVTWQVHFKSRRVYFVPAAYAMTVKELIEKISESSGQTRKTLLQEILYEHDKYIQHMLENPELENNNNQYLKYFILPEVYQRWEPFWKDWPLRFVVYHDFIVRYPNEGPETSHAIHQLLNLIKEDISRIKEVSRFSNTIYYRQKTFLRLIYQFLEQNYPEAITEDMKPEAEKYLISE